MSILLHVQASVRGDRSHSRQAGNLLVDAIRATSSSLRVIQRDLASHPPPHLDGQFIDASLMSPLLRNDAAMASLAYSEALIAELESCDLLVIDTPMHNFTVPSTLKAWIDHVVRPGRTFQPGPRGKIGLLQDRPVLLVVASGGPAPDVAMGQADFLVPYLRQTLACVGLKNLQACHLDRLHGGHDHIAQATARVHGWIAERIDRLIRHAL